MQMPSCGNNLGGLQVMERIVCKAVNSWLEMMLEMNLAFIPILKLTPTEPPPMVACLRRMVPLTLGYVLLQLGHTPANGIV